MTQEPFKRETVATQGTGEQAPQRKIGKDMLIIINFTALSETTFNLEIDISLCGKTSVSYRSFLI